MSTTADSMAASRRSRRSGSSSTPATRAPALWLLAAVCLLAAAWLLPEAWRHLRADLTASTARGPITRSQAPTPLTSDEDWQEALATLERAVELTPDSPTAHADLGNLYAAAAVRPGLTDEQRLAYAYDARLHHSEATRLRPADPRSWADLARAHLLMRDAGPAYINAWELAAQLGPVESIVQSQLFDLLLATYPDPHTPEMAAWVKQLYANADAKKREAMQRVATSFDVTLRDDGSLAAPPPQAPAEAAAP